MFSTPRIPAPPEECVPESSPAARVWSRQRLLSSPSTTFGAGGHTPSNSERGDQQQRSHYERRAGQFQILVGADRKGEYLSEQDWRRHVGNPVHAAVRALQLTLLRWTHVPRHQTLKGRVRQTVERGRR